MGREPGKAPKYKRPTQVEYHGMVAAISGTTGMAESPRVLKLLDELGKL